MSDLLPPVARVAIAGAYCYGAAVHIANMLDLTGFDWSAAPLRWQVLDVLYLALDVTVVVGLWLRPRLGTIVFAFAALSQILLYTILRDWVLDVPPAFAPSPDERAYLTWLVAFHVASLAGVALIVWRRTTARTPPSPRLVGSHAVATSARTADGRPRR